MLSKFKNFVTLRSKRSVQALAVNAYAKEKNENTRLKKLITDVEVRIMLLWDSKILFSKVLRKYYLIMKVGMRK